MSPYFIWDYNLTEKQIRKILRGDNEFEKQWLIARILSHAHFMDVWKYLKVKEIIKEFPNLKMRPETKEAWSRALNVWGYHV